MICNRCGKLPEMNFDVVDIYISLPTIHHEDGFEKLLVNQFHTYEKIGEGYLVKKVAFEAFINLLTEKSFNRIEQQDVKVLPLNDGCALCYESLKHYKSLLEWHAYLQGKEVASIIDEKRIKTIFQPIIHVSTGTIYGYEALSRGINKDGSTMSPAELFETAKGMDLLFYLDRICRESAIRSAAHHKITKKVFINFIPTAIYEPELCLKSTAEVLNEVKLNASQVIFEVVESEKVIDYHHLNHILAYYKNKGYSTALDDIGSGYSDINALLQLKPDYMKIDASVIRDIHTDSVKQAILDDYIENGKRIGLTILAEGVETMMEYEYLKTKAIDLVQGYLFGRPEEVPFKE